MVSGRNGGCTLSNGARGFPGLGAGFGKTASGDSIYSRKSSRLCNPAWHSKSATCLSRVACSDNAARLDSSAVISKSAMFINYQVNHICRSCVSLGVFSFYRSLDLDGRPGCHGNGSMWVNSHAARSARSSFWVPHWDCMHVCLLHNQWSCHVKCNCILHS